MSSNQKSTTERVEEQLQTILERIDAPPSVAKTAQEIVNKTDAHPDIDLGRGNVPGASVYIASRKEGMPFPNGMIGEGRKSVSRTRNKLLQTLDVEPELPHPSDYLHLAADTTPAHVLDMAEKLLDDAIKSFHGAPNSKAAGALYAAQFFTEYNITQQECGELFGVSSNAVRSNYKSLLKQSREVNLSNAEIDEADVTDLHEILPYNTNGNIKGLIKSSISEWTIDEDRLGEIKVKYSGNGEYEALVPVADRVLLSEITLETHIDAQTHKLEQAQNIDFQLKLIGFAPNGLLLKLAKDSH